MELTSSIGDETTRFKQLEIRLADQKEVHNDRFNAIEAQLTTFDRRITKLEEKQDNFNYEEKPKGISEIKLEERIKRLEDKNEWLSNKLIDEKQLQLKIENFDKMRKNSKDKSQSAFQEDILNEINNLYSVI